MYEIYRPHRYPDPLYDLLSGAGEQSGCVQIASDQVGEVEELCTLYEVKKEEVWLVPCLGGMVSDY